MAILCDQPTQTNGVHTVKGTTKLKELSNGHKVIATSQRGQRDNIQDIMKELFAENVAAKMIRAARNGLKNNNPPEAYPEWVPQDGDATGEYELREADFWTCGFFPGTLYSLLERATRYPQAFPTGGASKSQTLSQLLSLARTWTGPIYPMATRTDTHDMSFIIQPSLRVEWELYGTPSAAEGIFTAARSLATRYNPTARAIRSWDGLYQNGREISSMTDDFLIIIDSMMNLDLLFYAGHHLPAPSLIDIATTHAHTIAASNLRPEPTVRPVPDSPYQGGLYSTFHVVNMDPRTGAAKAHLTAQGYTDASTWARGQAWGIFGFAQTYHWTRDPVFLSYACGLAEYFIARLAASPSCVETPIDESDSEAFRTRNKTKGRWVPLWDFDAPVNEAWVLRDSSAGVIAANGMLVLWQALVGLGRDVEARWYLDVAVRIVEDTLAYSLAREKARFVGAAGNELREEVGVEDVGQGRFDAVLKNATANYNARDRRRYWDHGLVYADYYLVEFGNRLLKLGLV